MIGQINVRLDAAKGGFGTGSCNCLYSLIVLLIRNSYHIMSRDDCEVSRPFTRAQVYQRLRNAYIDHSLSSSLPRFIPITCSF